MSDAAPLSPAIIPPAPASSSDGRRRSSATASLANDHAAPGSTLASAGSSVCPFPGSPPSLPSSISKAPPSVSGSRLTVTSPPTTISGGPGPGPALLLPHGAGLHHYYHHHHHHPHHQHRAAGASSASSSSSIAVPAPAPPPLNPELPTHDSQLHVAEARAALVASMSNMLDSELQSRASLLHANAAALSRQEQDVARATDALRKENDKLAKVARDAGRKIKELGNVQNWAEVLERDFLVLEETMRLVRRGSDEEEEDTCSECSGSYWSGSESGSEQFDGDGDGEAERRRRRRRRRGDDGDDDSDDAGLAGSKGSLGGGAGNKLLRGEQRDEEEEETETGPIAKDKGKGSATLDSGSSTIGEECTASNPSIAGSASGLSGSTHATVSLDEAILDSLAEALATDIRLGFSSTKQDYGMASSTGHPK